MKSFDILADRRHIQSDLIVANLPVRNDIAAYSWMVIDSKLIHNIVAEKAVSPVDNAGGIAIAANIGESITKYEIAGVYPVILNANAEFQVLLPLSLESNGVELRQDVQEVTQKIERAPSSLEISANDMLVVVPLKSTGNIENATVIDAAANEVKNAILIGNNSYRGLYVDAFLDNPLATYYENVSSATVADANVRSLSYLLHLRLIQSDVCIGVNSVYFDLYRSLGKLSAPIAIGANASFFVEYFTDGESRLELLADVDVFSNKYEAPMSTLVLACTGSAVLRRMRLLADVDMLGTITDISNMTLEDMYYEDIQE